MHCSMPDFPVLHYLMEFVQIHVHCIGDVIQLFDFLFPPFSFCPQSFPASGSFPMCWLFTSGGQSIGVSASVLPMNIQGWFPLRLTLVWSLCCLRDSQEYSPAPQFESINSSALSLPYGPTLTSVHDYWKNNDFNYTDLCWQSDVSAF